MRLPARMFFSFSLVVLLARALAAQTPQPAPASPAGAPPSVSGGAPQAAALLARAAAALGATATVSDVTLSGTARRIAGSDDETGQAVLKARASGQWRVDLNLPSGKRSEIRNVAPGFSPASPSASPAIPAGKWTGPDGVAHDIAYHNLIAEPVWSSPALLLSQLLANQNMVVANLGQEVRIGAPNAGIVQRLSVTQSAAGTSGTARLLQHLSQIDLFLDSSTLLPVALAFNIHPDNNALLDIPIEVRFFDYRSVQGVQVPFHVQKFLNNSLVLDFQFDSAALNSGLTTADFPF